mmetsp:Transcript_38624/g.109229  ORF Transcript_38624/g.109229 Transcript_38624/m.109229 type:complete len:209 (+) Transcript_38624:343-969(+)
MEIRTLLGLQRVPADPRSVCHGTLPSCILLPGTSWEPLQVLVLALNGLLLHTAPCTQLHSCTPPGSPLVGPRGVVVVEAVSVAVGHDAGAAVVAGAVKEEQDDDLDEVGNGEANEEVPDDFQHLGAAGLNDGGDHSDQEPEKESHLLHPGGVGAPGFRLPGVEPLGGVWEGAFEPTGHGDDEEDGDEDCPPCGGQPEGGLKGDEEGRH